MAATPEKSKLRTSQRTMDLLGHLILSLFFMFRSWTDLNFSHFYSEFSGLLFQVFPGSHIYPSGTFSVEEAYAAVFCSGQRGENLAPPVDLLRIVGTARGATPS